MLVINKLSKAGDIKQVVLRQEEVIVTLRDKQKIIYRKFDGNPKETE